MMTLKTIQSSNLSPSENTDFPQQYFKLIQLKNQLKEEITSLSCKIQDLEKTTQVSMDHFEKFKEMTTNFEPLLQQAVQQSIKENIKEITDLLLQNFEEKFKVPVAHLQTIYHKTEQLITQARRQICWHNSLIITGFFLTALFSAVGTTYFLPLLPTRMTEVERKAYNLGIMTAKAWPHLTEAERQKIRKG